MSVIALITALGMSYLDLRLQLATFILSACVALLLVVQRGIVRMLLLRRRHNRRRTLLYALQLDRDLFTIIHSIAGRTIEIVGLLHDSPYELRGNTELPWPVIGTWDELHRVAKQTGISHVLVVGCDVANSEPKHIREKCERLNLHCSILLDPRRLSNARPAYTFTDELPILPRPAISAHARFMYFKRAIDLVVGLCLLILASPMAALIAAIIKCDSRGPVFFRQQRIGRDGRSFDLLKFRTMHQGSPQYHRSPTSNCDPRITRFGRLLRRLSLDELPQLLNVLKGDMSLVGPRPEMPFIVDQYNEPAWARLVVRPGITGLWQISRARSLPIHHALQYDLFYIERQSIFLDCAILLRTFAAVVKGVGAA
jgi:exopolysaccharide biosynthesis polyprenyl glycosylphosphotransferase